MPAWSQLHFDCVAFEKVFTAFFTADTSVATARICAAEGFGGKPWTALLSALTDDVIALVWLGKSLLAELTSAAASFSTFVSCDFRPLSPLLEVTLGSALTEFWRLVRSEQ